MKQKRSGFAAGVLTTVVIGSLGITALAATGQLTIAVDPINIQVNGATFQPKDTQGQDVPVFAYNGTTYAPLRALAEAYGLEVGYDAEKNMATVGEEDVSAPPETTPVASTPDYSDWTAEEEAAYQEFKGMWNIKLRGEGDSTLRLDGNVDSTPWEAYNLICTENMQYDKIIDDVLKSADEQGFLKRLAKEVGNGSPRIGLWFLSFNSEGLIRNYVVE